MATYVRMEGLKGVLDTLKQLPPEIVSKGGGPVRSALRKAALIIRDQELLNLRAIINTPNKGDVPQESSGLLEKNIVVTRGRLLAGEQKGERYIVRVRNKAYPKEGDAKTVTTAQVARLLEYGTEQRPPYPFIRPAFEAKKSEALSVFEVEINKGIERVIRKLQRQNRVRS